MSKRTYLREIWQEALQKASKQYNTRADTVKTIFGILFIVAIVILLVGTGIWSKNQSIPAYLWALFSTDIIIIIGTILATPIMAYLDRWNVAAERDQRQENDKEILQKVIEAKQGQIDNLEDWKKRFERLASVKDIALQRIDMDSAIGIIIYNHEARHSFQGRLWITGVTKQRRFSPIMARVEYTAETEFLIPPGESVAVRLIDIDYANPNVIYRYHPSIAIDAINHIVFSERGEYIITTRLAGNFLDPTVTVSARKKWKFTIDEAGRLDLIPVEDGTHEEE